MPKKIPCHRSHRSSYGLDGVNWNSSLYKKRTDFVVEAVIHKE